jgi:hypothetical protein
MSEYRHAFDTTFTPPNRYEWFELERYRPGALHGQTGYTGLALQLGSAMQAIHARTETTIGAEQLAHAIAKKEGTFYVARDGSRTDRPLVAYAYHDSAATPVVLNIAELEAIDTKLGTDACRFAAAVTLHGAIQDNPGAHIITVAGRENIPEGRSPEFFSELGFRAVRGPMWGEAGATVLALRTMLEPRLQEIYEIPPYTP